MVVVPAGAVVVPPLVPVVVGGAVLVVLGAVGPLLVVLDAGIVVVEGVLRALPLDEDWVGLLVLVACRFVVELADCLSALLPGRASPRWRVKADARTGAMLAPGTAARTVRARSPR
jgi:hypothetical protein